MCFCGRAVGTNTVGVESCLEFKACMSLRSTQQLEIYNKHVKTWSSEEDPSVWHVSLCHRPTVNLRAVWLAKHWSRQVRFFTAWEQAAPWVPTALSTAWTRASWHQLPSSVSNQITKKVFYEPQTLKHYEGPSTFIFNYDFIMRIFKPGQRVFYRLIRCLTDVTDTRSGCEWRVGET